MAPLSLFGFLTFILATTALASSDASSSKNQLNPLLKRQSDAFVPDKNHGNGATCADAFGPGYYSCGTGIECVNPSKGQTCCSEGCMFSPPSIYSLSLLLLNLWQLGGLAPGVHVAFCACGPSSLPSFVFLYLAVLRSIG